MARYVEHDAIAEIAARQHERDRARIAELEAENKRLREALEMIAESVDAGRHDGLPEPCPAHDADTMFAFARRALED